MQLQMSAQETAFAICQRIGRSTHFTQIRIRSDVKLSDQIQIIIQHLVEIFILLTGFRQNHRQMQRYHADIKSSHKYRAVLLVRRMHAASLIPGRQKRTTPHRRDHFAVLLIHTRNISFTCETQPVRIHCLGRALHTRLKHIFQLFARPVQILVIQEYNLGEQHRLLTFLPALSLPAHIEHCDRCQFRKSSGSDSGRHGNKRIISAAACHCIKLILPALKSLFKLFLDICKRLRLRGLFIHTQLYIFLYVTLIGFLRIRL